MTKIDHFFVIFDKKRTICGQKLPILAKNDILFYKTCAKIYQNLAKYTPISNSCIFVITTSECLQSKQTLCTIVTVSTEVAQHVGTSPKT